MTYKKKLLFYGENSLLNSGYGTYAYNLLHKLAASGRYEITEIAGFGDGADPRIKDLPWSYRPNTPQAHQTELMAQYQSRPSHAFGEFVMDGVCLDFRPDVVLSIRDIWFDNYVWLTPARKYFNHIQLAPVDSAPQQPSWITDFASCNAILTYSDYGLDVLKKEGQGNLPLIKSAFAGVDTNHFKPLNKEVCRRSLGIPEDAFVVGSAMRAQPRKLFADLLKTFTKFIETAPAPIAAKSYLVLHTKYPDISFDFNALLQEFGIGHRVFFSYVCDTCRAVHSSLFRGGKAICKACGQHAAVMPGIQNGINSQSLAYVFNAMDCYVQYANCEGFGMPMVEAAACAVPVLAVDYSAMSDICRKVGGIPIRTQGMFRDIGVGADRAYPDNDDFLAKLLAFARLPKELRLKYENLALSGVQEFFTWDKVAATWIETIDSLEPKNLWDSPPNIHELPTAIPDGMTHAEFVKWGFEAVAGRPDLTRNSFYSRFIKDLENGYSPDGQICDRNKIMSQFAYLGETKNAFERERCQLK